jgi:acyl-coenzyme A thioesterase PaaI-like protein
VRCVVSGVYSEVHGSSKGHRERHVAVRCVTVARIMLARLLPNIEKAGNSIRDAWDRLHTLPGGTQMFSRLVGIMAPYTGSMGASVVELERGRSRVLLRDRRSVRNHLRCVHAIALANLAELAGNIVVAYSLPDDARFIVSGLSIEYVKKARGTLTATCEMEVPSSNQRAEIQVPVIISDAGGDVVARATLHTLIGPKKR